MPTEPAGILPALEVGGVVSQRDSSMRPHPGR